MKVLVAPLDWGLGHATRCMPVIQEFLRQGFEVEIGCVKSNAKLFRESFPSLRQRLCPSYGIVYPKFGFNMGLWLLKNSAHLNAVIRFEHRFANEMVKRHGYDVIFSDNRFGFYGDGAKNIYMTHQLRIAFPAAFSFLENIGIRFHSKMMKRFDEVWVPDFKDAPGLSGSLSHGVNNGVEPTFVGPLSRFQNSISDFSSEEKKEYKVVAIISGVEPARSRFECILKKSLKQIPGKHVLILGKPSATVNHETDENLEIYSHLPTDCFASVVKKSEWVLSRGGYSTVMDMACLQARCIFVPTPGQYEQVKLSAELSKASYCSVIPESRLNADAILHAFEGKPLFPLLDNAGLLSDAVTNLKNKLK